MCPAKLFRQSTTTSDVLSPAQCVHRSMDVLRRTTRGRLRGEALCLNVRTG